tara:strand:- start:354 stop:515 length:162 start_codon:yes stop_codon:yes gene_type:complete
MKILKEVSRKYKGKEYIKYKVNLPNSLLDKAKLKEGDELIAESGRGKIVLKKS